MERMKQPPTRVSERVAAATSDSVFIVTELSPLSIDTMCAPAVILVCGLTNSVSSNITFFVRPASTNLYSISNCTIISSDVKVSLIKSTHPFHSFNVGFPIIAFTATSFPNPNDNVGKLAAIVTYYTRYTSVNKFPIFLSFGLGNEVAVNTIIGKPTLKEWKGCVNFNNDTFTSLYPIIYQ